MRQEKMTHSILWMDLFRKTERKKKISGTAEVETILGLIAELKEIISNNACQYGAATA